jgi:hypothetical protein
MDVSLVQTLPNGTAVVAIQPSSGADFTKMDRKVLVNKNILFGVTKQHTIGAPGQADHGARHVA